jgi:hypothetical protein
MHVAPELVLVLLGHRFGVFDQILQEGGLKHFGVRNTPNTTARA